MKAQNLINQFYKNEQEENALDARELAGFTVRTKLDTAHMLQAISDRFNEPRSRLAADLLEDAVLEMFKALTPDDRSQLAAKADELTTAEMLKRGYTSETTDHRGKTQDTFGGWVVLAHVFNELDSQEGEA